MRIVGGRLSGRRIRVPSDAGVRPTSDRVREAIASALTSRAAFEGAFVLELFAGSGAFSFEALSRGAASAHLVDSSRACLRVIEENARELDVRDQIEVRRIDLSRKPGAVPDALPKPAGDGYTLVFADPPYEHADWFEPLVESLAHAGRLADGALVVLEHRSSMKWAPKPPLALESNYRYGDTAVTVATYFKPEGKQ